MSDKRFSLVLEQTKLEKIEYRNMEEYGGNQSWGQWPMQLAKFHCTKKCMKNPFRNARHYTHVHLAQ